MSLQIQMLGTGSAFAKKFYNNNALVYCNGYTLLIDCGFTAPRSLYELKIPLNQIDAILITHIHADHVGGLEEMAFQLKYVFNTRIKLIVPATIVDPLWDTSLKGGLSNPAEGMTGLDDYFEVIIVDEGDIIPLHDGFNIELVLTEHIPNKPSYSVYLNDNTFFSADMKFMPALIHHVHYERKCKYILHECQLFSPGLVHATLDELLTLPESIQEKILLMHYGDNISQFVGNTGRMEIMEQHRIYQFP
ncbi:MBL fold metallo-hydrolase [Paenibacillus thalictri]|uniref:Ribonuclease Z n=1 Tax=Paenibacillus thalictri TaxID=2527873 RepID=A0A4Q9DR06_9BACL|nr:MBL fold metallo-hydrolase [Paenibacillus thalictri]TBL78232.1 ribonuclease Z [Paenibacillus thalictri]